MADNICTDDEQITKIIANTRKPIIVETKTTTTTKVTKRIFIADDTSIDLTDIETLLEIKGNSQPKISIAPPNANVITKNVQHYDTSRRATNGTNLVNEKQNSSFLSSTKIDNLAEFDEIADCCFKTPALEPIPNLSEIKIKQIFETKDKNINKKMPKERSVIPKTAKRARSNTIANKSNSKKGINYIDGLINEYMTLEKNPRRKQSKKQDKEEKETLSKENSKTQCAPLETKDLSAIFELSTEIETPLPEKNQNISTMVDDICNDDYDNEPIDKKLELHNTNQPVVGNKSTRKLSKTNKDSDENKVIKSETRNRRNQNSKKLPKIDRPINAASQKSSNNGSNENHSPIKIYSPSTRGKLRTGTDNRLVLTKKMIEKKLQKHPESSKIMLQRLGHSNEMTIDADSRLIYYPNNTDESEKDVAKGTDFLSVLQKRCNPLLVKEVELND